MSGHKTTKIGMGAFFERQVCDVKVHRRAAGPIKCCDVNYLALPEFDDQIACIVSKLLCGMVNLTSMDN